MGCAFPAVPASNSGSSDVLWGGVLTAQGCEAVCQVPAYGIAHRRARKGRHSQPFRFLMIPRASVLLSCALALLMVDFADMPA